MESKPIQYIFTLSPSICGIPLSYLCNQLSSLAYIYGSQLHVFHSFVNCCPSLKFPQVFLQEDVFCHRGFFFREFANTFHQLCTIYLSRIRWCKLRSLQNNHFSSLRCCLSYTFVLFSHLLDWNYPCPIFFLLLWLSSCLVEYLGRELIQRFFLRAAFQQIVSHFWI